jgi:hypothetical protein
MTVSLASILSGSTYADSDAAALAALLSGEGVRLSEVAAPVSSTDGNDAELGDDDGGADRSSDFLGRLDAKADVALRVSDDDNGLEPGALAGASLLLHRLDLENGEHLSGQRQVAYLHDLVLQLRQEEVHDLVLLDGQRVKVDFLHALDFASLDEPTQLGDGLPLFLLALAATAPAPSTSATTAPISTAVSARAESSTTGGSATSGSRGSSVSHSS